MDDQFKKLIDYARGGAPRLIEPTIQDEILGALDTLAADIRSGKVVPSHLIIGWGTSTKYGDEDATSYVFDSFGLNRWETIGHLHAYASRLAIGGDID